MTYLEAYKAIFSKNGSSISDADAAADLGLIGLDPADTYDTTNLCALYGSALSRMNNDAVGIQQITEGGYTIVYDKADKAKVLYGIAQDSGCADLINKYRPQPKVRNRSYLW